MVPSSTTEATIRDDLAVARDACYTTLSRRLSLDPDNVFFLLRPRRLGHPFTGVYLFLDLFFHVSFNRVLNTNTRRILRGLSIRLRLPQDIGVFALFILIYSQVMDGLVQQHSGQIVLTALSSTEMCFGRQLRVSFLYASIIIFAPCTFFLVFLLQFPIR